MEHSATPIDAAGLFEDGELVAIVVYNGRPTYYTVKEMNNADHKKYLEIDKARTL